MHGVRGANARICRESGAVVRATLSSREVPWPDPGPAGEAGMGQLAVTPFGGTVGEVTGQDKGGQ
jgi:hypothetical protein